MKHECAVRGRSNCEARMQLEIELWEAINRYASSAGGDPSRRVYGNVPRMQAVADVNMAVRKHRGSPGSDVVESLTKEGKPYA